MNPDAEKLIKDWMKYAPKISNFTDYDDEDILDELNGWGNTKGEPKKMKKCEVTMPDGNGKISIGLGCMFISPANNGFMVYTNPEGNIEINCFSDIDGVIEFVTENKLLDLTQCKVVNNV